MSTSALSVFHEHEAVGLLDHDDTGALRFVYARSWLDSASAFPISLRIPLTDHPFLKEAQTFFPNLLPEGNVRLQVARRLGISVENDFALLAAIGGECAGALSLVPAGGEPRASKHRYKEIAAQKLIAMLNEGGALTNVDATRGVRLSLAGAQDKLPVRLEDDRILLPVGNAPSTHILKFESKFYKHLPANEAFMMALARELVIPTSKVTLRRVGRHRIFVTERFDRVVESDGTIRRKHQEDLCQALALPPARKYEKEGGPTFAESFGAITGASVDPLRDARTLLRWFAFNAITLNADGHAKNLSLLYQGGACVLAPAYDLVCTRAYPSLDRYLAMSVGGQADPTLLLRRHWESVAGALGVGRKFVVELVREMAEQIPAALEATQRNFRDQHGDSPVLQLVLPPIRKQAKRIRQQLQTA